MAFEGKVVLITGGGSGMGRTAARQLASQGASVAILDVNEAGMAETADGYPSVTPFVVDISDTDAVHGVVQQVERELGAIDRVYNAAAIMPFGKLLEQDPKVQLKLMQINYGGLVNIATATLPKMIARGSGDFISFSSMSGIVPGLLMGGIVRAKVPCSCTRKCCITKIVTAVSVLSASSARRHAVMASGEATVVPELIGGETYSPLR